MLLLPTVLLLVAFSYQFADFHLLDFILVLSALLVLLILPTVLLIFRQVQSQTNSCAYPRIQFSKLCTENKTSFLSTGGSERSRRADPNSS